MDQLTPELPELFTLMDYAYSSKGASVGAGAGGGSWLPLRYDSY